MDGIVPHGARVDLFRGDITRLACATATFARADQMVPKDSERLVRNAVVSFRQGIDTLACFGVAFCACIFSVPTIHQSIRTARRIAARVLGARVTVIAIELCTDDADPIMTAPVATTLAHARAPTWPIAGARVVVAVFRALIAVIPATGTKVLYAPAANADVTRTAARSIGLTSVVAEVLDWPLVRLTKPRRRLANTTAKAFVYRAGVAVTAVPAWTRITAPNHAQGPECEQKQHKAEQPTHRPPLHTQTVSPAVPRYT
jgi:hypothetical protein